MHSKFVGFDKFKFLFHDATFLKVLRNTLGNAFSQCTSISTATLEEGVVSIDSGAFGGCESLKSLFLPDSLIEIDNGIFYSYRPERKVPDDIQITYKGNLYSKEMISQLVKDING